jgi:hypothetical protein
MPKDALRRALRECATDAKRGLLDEAPRAKFSSTPTPAKPAQIKVTKNQQLQMIAPNRPPPASTPTTAQSKALRTGAKESSQMGRLALPTGLQNASRLVATATSNAKPKPLLRRRHRHHLHQTG